MVLSSTGRETTACYRTCAFQEHQVIFRAAGGNPGEPGIDLILARYLGKEWEECTVNDELHLKVQVRHLKFKT